MDSTSPSSIEINLEDGEDPSGSISGSQEVQVQWTHEEEEEENPEVGSSSSILHPLPQLSEDAASPQTIVEFHPGSFVVEGSQDAVLIPTSSEGVHYVQGVTHFDTTSGVRVFRVPISMLQQNLLHHHQSVQLNVTSSSELGNINHPLSISLVQSEEQSQNSFQDQDQEKINELSESEGNQDQDGNKTLQIIQQNDPIEEEINTKGQNDSSTLQNPIQIQQRVRAKRTLKKVIKFTPMISKYEENESANESKSRLDKESQPPEPPPPPPKPFPSDRCANCMKVFESDERKSCNVFQANKDNNKSTPAAEEEKEDKDKLSQSESEDKLETDPLESSPEKKVQEITNIEALHLIFQIPQEIKRAQDICYLCQTCGGMLQVLYSAFKSFTDLTCQTEAYISKKLKEFSIKVNSGVKRGRRRKHFENQNQKKGIEEGGVGAGETEAIEGQGAEGKGILKEDSSEIVKTEMEEGWGEDEEDLEDGEWIGEMSDEDFQASPSDLAAVGVESSSTGSDDDIYVPLKKKRLVKKSRKKNNSFNNSIYWDEDKQDGFTTDDDFAIHNRKKTRVRKSLLNGITYDCNLCNASFEKPRELKQHLRDFHKQTQRLFPTEENHLSKIDESGSELIIGLEDEGEDNKPLKLRIKIIDDLSFSSAYLSCRLCPSLKFETSSLLKDHFEQSHEGEFPYQCPKCFKCYLEYSSLRKHEITHNVEKPYKCRVCSSAFRRADELQIHWAEKHASLFLSSTNTNADESSEGPSRQSKKYSNNSSSKGGKKGRIKTPKVIVPCQICGKGFARQDHLKLHMRIHTGEKPFPCSVCGKAFSDPRGLAYHEVTHSNERPYCCTICGMTFKRLHHLNDHERNHRDDIERPFSCDTCNKSFKYKKHLNSHMVIHGNSKDHQCEICGKAFNRKDNLRQHVKKVHGKEPGPSTMSFVVTNAEPLEISTTGDSTTTTPTTIVTQTIPIENLDQIVYMHL